MGNAWKIPGAKALLVVTCAEIALAVFWGRKNIRIERPRCSVIVDG
jgi:hypothetical protein